MRFIDEWRAWERRRVRRWVIGTASVGLALVVGVLAAGLWYIHAVILREAPPENVADGPEPLVDVSDAFAAPVGK